MKNFAFIFFALMIAALVVFRGADAAPSGSYSAQVALATPSIAPTASQVYGTPTADYMATKVALDNQSVALGITMTVDFATQQAMQTAAEQKKLDEKATNVARVEQEDEAQKKKIADMDIDAKRQRLEYELWMFQFWEWLKFAGATLALFLAFTAGRYFIPVMAARISYVYQQPVVIHQADQVRESLPAGKQEILMRFMLSRDAGRTYERGEFPGDLIEPTLALAKHVSAGGGWSEEELIGDGKVFKSRNALYAKAREFFKKYDLLVEVKSPDGSTKHFYINAEMKEYLAQFLAQYREQTGETA